MLVELACVFGNEQVETLAWLAKSAVVDNGEGRLIVLATSTVDNNGHGSITGLITFVVTDNG